MKLGYTENAFEPDCGAFVPDAWRAQFRHAVPDVVGSAKQKKDQLNATAFDADVRFVSDDAGALEDRSRYAITF
jgi:hypothetical protein